VSLGAWQGTFLALGRVPHFVSDDHNREVEDDHLAATRSLSVPEPAGQSVEPDLSVLVTEPRWARGSNGSIASSD